MLLSVVLAAICLPSVAAVQGAAARADVSTHHTTSILASGSALELGLAGKRLMRAESDGRGQPMEQNLMAGTPDGSDQGDVGDNRVPVPPDPFLNKVEVGPCITFVEGSSIRDTGESATLFSNIASDTECWGKCDNDGACEQAQYDSSTTKCRIGTNSMATKPAAVDPMTAAGKAAAAQSCYAKNGFGYTLPYIAQVKPGFCNDFQAGYGAGASWDDVQNKMLGYPAGVDQCDFNKPAGMNGKGPEQCSHWGPEFGLSERGCWAKCKKTIACTQAVYENKNNSWQCFIGTKVMTQDPGASRCDDCSNTCYDHFGTFDGSGAAPGNATAIATAAAMAFGDGSPTTVNASATVATTVIATANMTGGASVSSGAADDGGNITEDIGADGVDTGAN